MRFRSFHIACKVMTVCLLLHFLPREGNSQSFPDTIYYDELWRICEKPIASYYRTCTLQKDSLIYFKGVFRDYTLEHTIQAIGAYDKNGRKNGLFTYYYSDGKLKMHGLFKNDQMNGLWYYYHPDGNLYYINNYVDNKTATPLFIALHDSVLLNDGAGSFAVSTDDFPDVFQSNKFYIEGASNDSLKNGLWTYSMGSTGVVKSYTEYYEDGKFLKGFGLDELKRSRKDFKLIDFVPEQTRLAESFLISLVFGNLSEMSTYKKLADFLKKGNKPEVHFDLEKYYNNLEVLATFFAELVTPGQNELKANTSDFFNSEKDVLTLYSYEDGGYQHWRHYSTGVVKLNNISYSQLRQIQTKAPKTPDGLIIYRYENVDLDIIETLNRLGKVFMHCRFLVNKDGSVSDLFIDANISEKLQNKIRYYLSTISGLVPNSNNKYTDLYFYSAMNKMDDYNVHSFFLSYYDRSNLH